MELVFREPNLKEINHIHSLESTSYPADEAASLETLIYRLSNAPLFFLAAYRSDQLLGYICSTATQSPTLTHESMFVHQPAGTLLCIHSVVISPSLRRQGIATRMLKEYINMVKKQGQVRQLRLLCKDGLVGLYSSVGFEVVGPSSIVHGADQWIEMVYEVLE
jgi:ribosomal protein S18 acetylase RimI-like enzyme